MQRRCVLAAVAVAAGLSASGTAGVQLQVRPNVVLVMADDMGWGEVSYYGHHVLEAATSTPWPRAA